ncbi:MAG: hypothetical protein HYZ27_00670, partial [Deltaproteobacteria bacterium]|nr:hypothetical protein [Deltaproteobacteria bacterium]
MDARNYPDKLGDYVFIDESELKDNSLEKHKKSVEEGKLEELSRRGKLVLLKKK